MVRLVYFAWVRERVGLPHEDVVVPNGVTSIAGLIAWLAARGEHYAYAFEAAASIRAAIDKKHVKHEALIEGAREIAFFPPMTGG